MGLDISSGPMGTMESCAASHFKGQRMYKKMPVVTDVLTQSPIQQYSHPYGVMTQERN